MSLSKKAFLLLKFFKSRNAWYDAAENMDAAAS
jgi:hypothetical protein